MKGQNVTINDGPFRQALDEFKDVIKKLKSINDELRNESILGTMAFMAKQIHEMQKNLSQMHENGIKKKIQLDFTLDGYEMVKRKSEKRCIENETPEDITYMLLATLDERESKTLLHRYALGGGKKKTYNQIGDLFGVSGNQAAIIHKRALRKCRHPSRRELVDNLTHGEFRKDIKGE